ncbi:ABC transporter permease [Adhaeribacter pallidiroseus]|uniref:Macrolide export ATP-binding/permease protein MacB n=1 Tax=Adhaeribacter pallidiroseus TaxID=2072847 RepID=A0A369QL34_9BACT|nr:ABC transporter permease [Adhaeribacter pallidiroseus]RDC65611.1 Macrolide export ATP-binding/permease protein MacB [Adhaeribacter pallidiroseus]
MFRNNFKIALRNFWKYPAFSAINILGLAIGVSACLIIYLLVRFELSYDTFHADRNRIYRVVSQTGFAGEIFKNCGVSGALPNAMQQEITGLASVAPFHLFYAQQVHIPEAKGKMKKLDLSATDYHPAKANYILVNPQYFAVFKYEWLAGNAQTALHEPYKVVLSEKQASKYFGNQKPVNYLGKILTYLDGEDTLTVTVAGVVRDFQQNTDFHFTDFISLASAQSPDWENKLGLKEWGGTSSSSQLLIKLTPNTTPAQIAKQFPGLIDRHIPKDGYNNNRSFLLQPLADIHFNADYGSDFVRLAHRPTLYALMGVAVFLLLMAGINFINLATSQSVQRTKEIGVRKVLGSSRYSLITQFLSETFVLALVAVLLAVLLTNPLLAVFRSFLPPGIHLPLFSPAVLLFLVGLTIITTLLAGFYPALVLSAAAPIQSLKGQISSTTTRKAYLRKTLIVFQFTLSQAFILGALVVGAQINFMRSQDMGFKQDEIVTFELDWRDKTQNKFVLLNKIRQMPEVAQVSLSNSTPARSGTNTMVFKYHAGKEEISWNVHNKSGDENFINLYGIKLLAGRNIFPSDTLREILINETYAKAIGFKQVNEAVGHYAMLDNKKLPIVGVVADFHVQSLHKSIEPVFIGAENKFARTISLKLATRGKQAAEVKATLAKLEKEYQALYPEQKFNYAFFDETIAHFYDNEQKMATIVRLATDLAIFIACLGLIGLVAFTVTQRTKEIGIRKVLGASVTHIVALLSRDFLKLVVLANVVAWPLAGWAMHRWLQDFAYRVPLSAGLFILAGISAISIALLAVSFQAIKAAVANPVKSLRTE